MSATPARRAAYRVLIDVQQGRRDLPAALAAERARLDDPRDQALAAAIAIGTERWRAALDFLIERYSRRPIDAIDPEVLAILRLSAFQLLHLSRVPPSAAVADGVELVRDARKKSAAGFVNAVLRAISRARSAPPLPPRSDLLDYFSITLSHPRWLVERWVARYGAAATETWLRFNNEEAPLTVRANLLKTSVEGLAARLQDSGVSSARTGYAPHGLIVTAGNPIGSPLEHEGLFVAQDEASQLVGMMVPARPGDRILDACASPGGKTTGMAAEMGNRGMIIASDVRARRVALLRDTVQRSGATCVRVTQADLARPAPFAAAFDAVLLDAPCSGLGTLRRDPDIKWRRTEADLGGLAAAERTLLGHAADAVRPGGWLVYATCSSEPDENEDVVRGFLASRPDYSPAPAPARVASAGAAGAPSPIDSAGHLRTYPHVHGLEAFFAAVFRRSATAGS